VSSGCRRGPRTKDGQILWQHDQSWDTRNLAWEPDQSLQTGDAWEHTRGIGFSFGYNQIEDKTTTLSGPALVRHFVDVVARGGNLLINVGLTAPGEIPPLQRTALDALGAWNATYGHAVFGSRPGGPAMTSLRWHRWTRADGRAHLFLEPGDPLDVNLLPGQVVVDSAVDAHGRPLAPNAVTLPVPDDPHGVSLMSFDLRA